MALFSALIAKTLKRTGVTRNDPIDDHEPEE